MQCLCFECGKRTEAGPAPIACDCGGLLEAVIETPELASDWKTRRLSVWKYKEFLPHHAEKPIVSLREGGTPLVESAAVAEWAGVRRLWVKVEGANPTGSFKDRGMTAALSWALGFGPRTVGCASTGNTSASMAAYAARAGVPAVVLLPAGKVAAGKMAQARAHGALLVELDGNFDEAMAAVLGLAEEGLLYLLNSKNPMRLEGQKTLAMEIVDERGWRLPDRIVWPVGNAGNISAGHKALRELNEAALIDGFPMLTGIQAAGAAPIAKAIAAKADRIEPVKDPETLATAIRIGNPVSARKALAAIRSTGGTALAVSDEAITEAQRELARREGLFVEPASAAPLAGLRALVASGVVDRSEEVVCVATGHGLKDPDAAGRFPITSHRVVADINQIRKVIP